MLPLVSLLAAGVLGGLTPDSFHLMKIKEVYLGSDAGPGANYVVLQMYAPGQNFVMGKQIRMFGRDGTFLGAFTFGANVAVGLDQSTILMADPAAVTFFANTVQPDLLSANSPFLDPLGGKLCFHDPSGLGDIDCVSWGGYAGDPAGVGTPFNTPVGVQHGMAIRRRMDICGLPTNMDGCDDTDNSATDFVATSVLAPRNNAGQTGVTPPSICGNSQLQSLEQCDDGNLNNGDGCSSTCTREPSTFAPMAVRVDTNGNGVFEPGESVVVAPSWRNQTPSTTWALSGTLSTYGGPPGAAYTVVPGQGTVQYGNIPPGSIVECTVGACYGVAVSNPTPRPVVHWDAVAAEVNNFYGFKNWTLHIGKSFTDVPNTSAFYKFIETLLHRGVTGGCTSTAYCPASTTTRDAMSVFVLVAKEGPGYNPPACGTPVFPDVPASSPFCKFIEELFRRGVVSGCGGGNYCPSAPVTRDAMAVFVLRTLDPALNPPACVAGSEMFADVPATNGFCRWIEELARRNVVTGCGGGNYCPSSAVTREQMGVFITATFGLTLYGL